MILSNQLLYWISHRNGEHFRLRTRVFVQLQFILIFLIAPSAWMLPQGRPESLSSNIDYDSLARNEIHTWVSNIGIMNQNPHTGSYSFEWPGGSGRTYTYQDGFCIAGRMRGTGDIRADGTMCNASWQPGTIRNDGNAADPEDGNNRLYRVRRLSPALYSSLPLVEQQVLKQDYHAWPVFQGAPWRDVDRNSSYDPDFSRWLQDPTSADGPIFPGDEMLWGVMNDLDTAQTRLLFGTIPIGLEVNTAVWAYDLPDCRGRAIFTRNRIIHKGSDDLDSAYFAIWSDPDIGSGLDDFVGIDTVRQLAYGFNGEATDLVYGNIGALGYLLLQGPAVPAPGHSARRCGRTETDMKNLPFTAYTIYANGVLPYTDPDRGVSRGARMLYNNMKGLFAYGAPFVDPHTGDTTTLMIAGDPVMETGWLDSDNLPPGDRRFLASCGPFNLAVGDTQEVIYARIAAEGGTPAEDVAALRRTADCILQTYQDTPLLVGSDAAAVSFSLESVYPNPLNISTQRRLVATILTENQHSILIRLSNAVGRVVAQRKMTAPQGKGTFILDLPGDLSAGTYQLTATDGLMVESRRVMLLK